MIYPQQPPGQRPYGPPPYQQAPQQGYPAGMPQPNPAPAAHGRVRPPRKARIWPWLLVAGTGALILGVLALVGIAGTTTTSPNVGTVKSAGTAVRDGQFEFVVTKIEQGATKLGDGIWKETAQGEFVLVHIKVTNTGKEQRSYYSGSQVLIDDKGREFKPNTGADQALPNNVSGFAGDDLNPGFSLDRILAFDVPKGTVPAAMEFHDSTLSGGVKVAVK